MEKNIRKYLEENILITDGAMGTYFAQLKPNAEYQYELGSIYDEDIIYRIHREYIAAGAKLIRTNTFNANISSLGDRELVKKVIENAVKIAKRATENEEVFIGGSIGPIADIDVDYSPYYEIADTFLENDVNIFIFETFNDYRCIKEITKYIKNKDKNAFIITQFALTDVGITKKSVYAESIIENLENDENVDVVGFNCGVGPMHMLNIIKRLEDKPRLMSALPNAGYPEIIDGKLVYVMNPKYFAKMVYDISKLGVKIVGGCCGTTPEHIRLLKETLNSADNLSKPNEENKDSLNKKDTEEKADKNKFHKAINNNEFITAVELDPPFKTDAQKLITGAKFLKEKGVNIITIADSPMGKSRADSVVISSKILREAGIDTLPHICCRDRNSVALRSAVLGAYIEGIRNFLVVTGDPVPNEARVTTKSVFNLNSYSLVKLVEEMNESVFENEKVKVGCAVNFNVKNKDSELKRLLKKKECGAEFFLTQPIFSEDTIEYIKSLDKNRDYRILGGIMPLVSYKNAQFINNELPGITIPEEYLDKFKPDMSREEAQRVGIEVAVEIGKKIKPYVDGFYITAPFNRYEMVGEILDRLEE